MYFFSPIIRFSATFGSSLMDAVYCDVRISLTTLSARVVAGHLISETTPACAVERIT